MKYSKTYIRKLLKVSKITPGLLEQYGARSEGDFYKIMSQRLDRTYSRFLATLLVTYEGEHKVTTNGRETWAAFQRTNRISIDRYIETGDDGSVLKRREMKRVQEYIQDLEQMSGLRNIELVNVTEEFRTLVPGTVSPLITIRMRNAQAMMLDVQGETYQDPGNGRCVLDYLAHLYGKTRGLIKEVKMEKLATSFKALESDPLYDPLTDGVSTEQLYQWCNTRGIPMYALDEDDKTFCICNPPNKRKDYPVLAYRMLNGHMYPVENKDTRVNISKKAVYVRSDNIQTRNFQAKEIKPTEPLPTIVVENVEDPMGFFVEKMREEKMMVFPGCRNITIVDGELCRFTLNKKTYIINQQQEKAKQMAERLNIEYSGQSANGMLFEVIKQVGTIPRSNPNPEVLESLTARGVKSKAYYGCANGVTPREVEEAYKAKNLSVYDISRCYTACMYNPYENWYRVDFNDHWKPYDGKLTQGLYYVQTKDTTLLHKNNIYSAAILKKAKEENIKFKILRKLAVRETLAKDTFTKIIDRLKDVCGDDQVLFKSLCNTLSGYMGKHKTNTHKVSLNSQIDQVFAWLSRHSSMNDQQKLIINTLNIGDQKAYLYGVKTDYAMVDNHLPIYLQIKDFSNMRLYDMVKQMGGKLAFRKTDLAACIGGTVPIHKETEQYGGYRVSELPRQLGEESFINVEPSELYEWTTYDHIKDSDQAKEIFEIAETGGVLVCGRAGTGKTHVIKEVCELIRENGETYKLIAPTNKAALVLGGTTIHKALKLNKEYKTTRPVLESLGKKFNYIIVDEISMVGRATWKSLYDLKLSTGAKIILVGDHRQCAPVETGTHMDNYFDHAAVKFIANYNRVELTTPKRYDMTLWNALEDVMAIKKLGNGEEHRRSICYTNTTRRRINRMWMDREKPEDAPHIKCPHKNEHAQDVWLYKDLPIISIHTTNDGSLVNNESFTVEQVTDETFDCYTTRAGEEGEPEDYRLTFNHGEFHERFHVNYCSTTHKAQGETIKENYTIYDWNQMDKRLKYTALSRAKDIGQVSTIDTPYNREETTRLAETLTRKIRGHIEYDEKRGWTDTDITVRDCVRLFRKQGGLCRYCACDMKTHDYHRNDPKQVTIDRIDNDKAHKCGNVVLACWNCNRSRVGQH